MTRRRSSGARPGRPAAAAPEEDSNGTIGEYCSGTDTCYSLVFSAAIRSNLSSLRRATAAQTNAETSMMMVALA